MITKAEFIQQLTAYQLTDQFLNHFKTILQTAVDQKYYGDVKTKLQPLFEIMMLKYRELIPTDQLVVYETATITYDRQCHDNYQSIINDICNPQYRGLLDHYAYDTKDVLGTRFVELIQMIDEHNTGLNFITQLRAILQMWQNDVIAMVMDN